MRIVLFSADPGVADLTNGSRPDATVTKGSQLADLVAIILGLLAEGSEDLNPAWSHSPTKEAEHALDLVDSRLIDTLPGS
jgi:hypothetical protein